MNTPYNHESDDDDNTVVDRLAILFTSGFGLAIVALLLMLLLNGCGTAEDLFDDPPEFPGGTLPPLPSDPVTTA